MDTQWVAPLALGYQIALLLYLVTDYSVLKTCNLKLCFDEFVYFYRNKKSVISIKIIAMATLIHKIYNIYSV